VPRACAAAAPQEQQRPVRDAGEEAVCVGWNAALVRLRLSQDVVLLDVEQHHVPVRRGSSHTRSRRTSAQTSAAGAQSTNRRCGGSRAREGRRNRSQELVERPRQRRGT
jgi:hypothetical protein